MGFWRKKKVNTWIIIYIHGDYNGVKVTVAVVDMLSESLEWANLIEKGRKDVDRADIAS